jgi:cytochrome c peroxidase
MPAAEKVDLGRQLFQDKRLSANGRMACATCHVPEQGFTQTDRATPIGRDGTALRRNASTLLNVAFATLLMHDGAAPSLEAQVLTPLLDANEMANSSFEDLERRLAAIPDYRDEFQSAFRGEPTMARVGEALAAYERTLVSGNSAFDRWKFVGIEDAVAPQTKRGFELFTGKAACVSCHAIGNDNALFSDNAMHNTGIGFARAQSTRGELPAKQMASTVDFAAAGDRGRHEVTHDPKDLFSYRTPTLRNVAVTAPYMHDGSLATLEDVVRFYNRGGIANPNLDPALRPLNLDDGDVAALVAFLRSLTGDNLDALAVDARAGQPPGVSRAAPQ